VIDFHEFTDYYNSMQDFLKAKLNTDSKHAHMLTKYREEYTEAKSKQIELQELVNDHDGKLLLDAHGHNYMVELQFHPKCVTAHSKGRRDGARAADRLFPRRHRPGGRALLSHRLR
jgi:hypothetical protein